jgi:glucose/arabinose dehydrogenase
MHPKIFSGLLLATGAAILAGCNSSAPAVAEQDSAVSNPVSSQTSSKSSTTASKTIRHSEGVPNGQKSPSGLTLPKGFKVAIFADGLDKPRRIAFAPGATPDKYDVFVAESFANRVRVLRTQGGQVRSKTIFTTALNQPYGIAFGHNSVYLANTDSVVRFPYQTGNTSTDARPEKIADLTKGGYNQHWTRNLLFSRDSKQLFVTVGSSCNTCEEEDSQRAAISVMKPDGSGKTLLATGLRNPVGLALRPGTNELWTAVNERDNLGDDIPPDYLTQVKQGGFYGWPYAYTDINHKISPDPNFGESAPQKVAQTIAPSVPVQAHSAALGVAFYPTTGGKFPADYAGDAFLAFHGSWNRSARTGYKIVRVDFQNGKPASVSDFVTGYLEDNGDVWGRPVDVQVAPDGSLLFSDDDGGKIWRVTYDGA